MFDEEAANAFRRLVDSMFSAPILSLPVGDSRFSIDTDALPENLGAALLQEGDEGQRIPICFWSRQLNAAETNYSATEKECLTLTWVVKTLPSFQRV